MNKSWRAGNMLLIAAIGIGALLTIAPFVWGFSLPYHKSHGFLNGH